MRVGVVNALERVGVAVAVACLVGLWIAGGASVGVGAQGIDGTDNATTNHTVHHERPGSASESGDLERLQHWLAGRLTDRLRTSTVALNRGEYERAAALLGERYDSRLGLYVEVANETGDTASVRTYRDVGSQQRSLAVRLREFDRAEQRYRTARENGDAVATRQAARRMVTIADRVDRTGENVTDGYETLSARTNADTGRARTAVTNVTRRVDEQAATVRATSFVETAVVAAESNRSAAFTDPLGVTGRLSTANGSAIAHRTVTVAVNGRAHTVETDASGSFALAYRPRTLRANASHVDVSYVPRNGSVYLGSTTTVRVDVERVPSDVRVRNATSTLGFGRPAGATAVVTVAGRPVDGVPVAASVGDHRVGRATTGENGSVRVTGPLPASVADGDRRLTLAVDQRGRAVGVASDGTAVRVESTNTTLDVAGERAGGQVRVTGRLATVDGRPVDHRNVTVTRDGSAATTVRTGPDGSYRAFVTAGNGSRTTVGARFDGDGTNLASDRSRTTVDSPESARAGGPPVASWAGETIREGIDPLRPYWATVESVPGDRAFLVVGGLVVSVTLGAGWLVRRRRRHPGASAIDDTPGADDSGSAPDSDPEPSDDGDEVSMVERAETLLERGDPGPAVRWAFAALQARYASDVEFDTHWDLLDVVEADDSVERSALEQVVQSYERDLFSASAVGHADARAAVAATRSVVEGEPAVKRPDDGE